MKPFHSFTVFIIFFGTSVVSALFPLESSGQKPQDYFAGYEVLVNGVQIDVDQARVQDPPWDKTHYDHGGTYFYASFDVEERTTVVVHSATRNLANAVILPENPGLRFTVRNASEVSFQINSPQQIILEPDGKNSPLLLFANPPEDFIFKKTDPDIIYFGPGVHSPELVEVRDNQTLYLAEGAVLKAGVSVTGNNTAIRGRGRIDGSDWAWTEGPFPFVSVTGNYVEIRDIIVSGSSHWTIGLQHCNHVTLDNIKICNGRVWNDDGIDIINSQDIVIKNCFIRSDDDCIALKGMEFKDGNNNIERILIEDCILWCDRARITLLGHECRAEFMRDITYRDIDIVHFSMVPFLLEPGEGMRLENVLFENIRINGEGQDELIRLKPVVNVYMHKKVPGHIDNITFKNLTLHGFSGIYRIELTGADTQYAVSDVRFIDVEILGKPLEQHQDIVGIGNFVSGVTFENRAKTTYPGISIDWVDVEGGEFEMGCPWGESSEKPVHQVKLDNFRISRHEITVEQYRAFCRSTGHSMPPEPEWGWVENHPIVNVSWADANSFAHWLGCRLPTEAEWEFAANGGNQSKNFNLSGSNEMDDVAWHRGNSPGETTQPVGQLNPNELGIFDMTGNAWEWVNDWYQTDYYRFSPLENPQGANSGQSRICRGGSFNCIYWISRNSARGTYRPNSRCPDLGFRIVMESQPGRAGPEVF